MTKFHRLNVVCVGPIIRVYVNDEVVMEVNEPEYEVPGEVGFTSHATSAYFDNLKLNPTVAPEECVMVEPWAENNALVFAPDKEISLQLAVHRHEREYCPPAWSFL